MTTYTGPQTGGRACKQPLDSNSRSFFDREPVRARDRESELEAVVWRRLIMIMTRQDFDL
jgi:hypothetical protein